jgi:hypothetical protein
MCNERQVCRVVGNRLICDRQKGSMNDSPLLNQGTNCTLKAILGRCVAGLQDKATVQTKSKQKLDFKICGMDEL